MKSNNERSNQQQVKFIREQLAEMGVDHELIKIEVQDGSKVVLRGEVCSEREKKLIEQIISDMVIIDGVVDGLIVVQNLCDDFKNDEYTENDGLYYQDDDDEVIGTEDMCQSIEDGIPYIPPTDDTYRNSPRKIKWKKKREKTR